MDEKKKLGSKLMAIHFEYEQMMASQNPYESMTKEWVEWQKEQSRKRYEYHLAQKALVNELFKGEGTVPTEEQMNIMLEPARKKIAEECEKIEQFKKQRFSKNDFLCYMLFRINSKCFSFQIRLLQLITIRLTRKTSNQLKGKL